MRWLDKLERHFGFLAIPNLMLGVIGGQALSTLLALKDPTVPLQLMLDPAAVAEGQWWRLFTWIIVPDATPFGLLTAVFWFMFLFSIGRALELEWGAFKSTVYLLLGMALPALGAMLLWQFLGIQIILTGSYFSITLLLAFAALAPELTMYLLFILPVKMRWVAWALGAWLLWSALSRGLVGAMEVGFGVGNYLIFFLPAGVQAWRQRRFASAGQKVFKEAKREAERAQARVCADCGRGAEADLRLCTCELCGEEGRNFCREHLGPHLALTMPSKPSPEPPQKQKRKS
jgi:hypothetical protein